MSKIGLPSVTTTWDWPMDVREKSLYFCERPNFVSYDQKLLIDNLSKGLIYLL